MDIKGALILVVDDQPVNLKLLLSFLKEHDFELRLAESGERALDLLEKIEPDVILLDVMMPGIDGFETCRKIKQNSKISDIPVIFMTALDSVEDKLTGFEVGGVDYITKPFKQPEVLARLKTHITLVKQKRELEHALEEVKKLSGILPICSFCKKIRDDEGYWNEVDRYIAEHSEAQFSHGLCKECFEEHYGEIFNKNKG